MLVFQVRTGDDVYINDKQVFLNRAEKHGLVVMTEEEEIFIPFGGKGASLSNDVRMFAARSDHHGLYRWGFKAHPSTIILTGRNYRRQAGI